MLTKHITVTNRVATYTQRDGNIICNNSGYKIVFSFDSEWNDKPTKYARFIWNGMYNDVKLTGNECSVPIIQGAERVQVGVCSGDPVHLTENDFWTTTPAVIPCKGSVLCLTDQAQPDEVQQMRDAAAQAAELAEKSAQRAAEIAETLKYVGGSGGSGVYVGSATPPDEATVWLDPNGDATSTEEWVFEMKDGTTVTKTVVVSESEEV